jgi:hypothetical protein
LGAAQGRAGPLLWEGCERGSGHLTPAEGWEGQGGARLGLAQEQGSGHSGVIRDMLCLIVEGAKLLEGEPVRVLGS